MKIAHLALLLVVVIDVMGQGLVLPLVNTLVMSPTDGMLPADTSLAARKFDYGLVIGVFFLAWFLGAAYISKLSDSIGRKNGILICLAGGFAGYVLTIVALYINSFELLILGRVISGFTAGNQPIAQAALVDISRSEEEKTRFMGLIVTAFSVGLIAGPLLGGALSDKALLGSFASLALPFYAMAFLIVVTAILIVVFFRDTDAEREPIRINPIDVFLVLWQALRRPLVRKVALVFFFFELSLISVYVFMDNYFTVQFHFGTLQNSIAMIVLGVALGLTSTFLASPLNKRFTKRNIIYATLILMGLGEVLFVVNSSPILAYVVIPFVIVPFAVNYPTMLTLFSASVDEKEQGWVMGVSTAVFTLAGGLMSLGGGELEAIDIHLPFMAAVVFCVIAIGLVALLWRSSDMAKLDPR